MIQKSEKLNAVEKSLKILTVITHHEKGLGTGEISDLLGLSMPTVSRVLSILSKHNFVRKNQAGNKYVFGKASIDIGRFASRHINSLLTSIARPHIDALRDAVEENAMLEVIEGDCAMIAYRASGSHLVNVQVNSGTMIPAHVSPGAKAILAFSPPEEIKHVLSKKLPRYTSNTIIDPEELTECFQEIRRKGIAFSYGERDIDVNAIGAPIFDHGNKPVAAVVISMPAFRSKYHKQTTLVTLIKETAREISTQLIKTGP